MTHPPIRFDVQVDTPLPDLADLTPDGARWDRAAETIESAYVDTVDRDLRRAGVTLSRRTGATVGWRLALPGRPDRDVVDRGRAVSGSDVPPPLAAAVLGVRRGLDLGPLATVTTHRALYRLVGAAGDQVLELADEDVHSTASTPDGARSAQWRRWAVTAAPDAAGPVAAVVERLAAGAAGGDHDAAGTADDGATDLDRALGVSAPGAAGVVPDRHQGKRKSKGKTKGKGKGKGSKRYPWVTAGAVILGYLREQDDALVAGDLTLREGPHGIHPTRVATRRLRSTLRIFAPFVDADRAAAFDTELSWYAATLGQVRDREVQRVRMRALVDEIPDELVLGQVATSIDDVLRSEEVLHRSRLAEALDSERYLALLREARRWSTTPPFTEAADQPAEVLSKRVHKAAGKLLAHLEAGLRHGGGDEELHSARKAGKRARYAAELAAPVLGKAGVKQVSRYQKVQDVLGDFQDGVVACALIRRLAAGTVGKRKENGFTYGLLYAREQERAIGGRERADALYAKLRR